MVDVFKVSYTVFKVAAERYPVYHFPTPSGDGYVLGTGHSQVVYTSTVTDSADVSDFISTLLVDSELSELEGDVVARPTLFTTGKLQKQFDLEDDNFIYVGTAAPGIATSAIGWTIERFTKVNGTPTDKQTTKTGVAIWDNRASEAYS